MGLAFAFFTQARAAEFSLQAYADVRLAFPAKEKSWLDGGLGKFRYGGVQGDPDFRFAEAVAQGALALGDDFHLVAVVRAEPKDRVGIDALELYASWQTSIGGWNPGFKAGAFFPPFSLENTDLGWTSPYTLTPSAINSWIGHELRTVGGEAHVSRETPLGTLFLTAAIFCCNDPAGALIANGGWTIDDRIGGLFETAPVPGTAPLSHTPLFRELDNRAGWYGGAAWAIAGIGRISIYRYDNDADANAVRGSASGWRTRFWSGGWESHFGPLSLLAQGLSGDTTIAFPGGSSTTGFKSVYALAAYDIDSDWRIAVRAETFATTAPPADLSSESGSAVTGAVSWSPESWLRVTGELIALTSRRGARVIENLAPRQNQTQFQLNTRLFF